jgi:hypothetical protein
MMKTMAVQCAVREPDYGIMAVQCNPVNPVNPV